jgi:cytoskeleton protein RodZ
LEEENLVMASVGELLKRERERQGLRLTEIAEQTRIKQRYLEALERDDFDSLPGRFFARSFTTQYAERLGVNGAELHDALERQVAPPQPIPAPGAGKEVIGGTSWVYQEYSVDPLPEGSASALNARKMTASVVMLLAVVVACGAIFWLWQRSQLSSTSASTAASNAENTSAIQSVAPPAVQPAPKLEPTPTPTPNTTAAVPASPTPAPAPPVDSNPQLPPAGKISLAITAKEDTWLRITADGKIIVQAVLTRGESRVLAAAENAKILLGNAGGVDIRFNGNDIGAVGPRGQVRTVDFTPEKFTVIEPQKKAPAETQTPQPVAEDN